MSNIWVPIEECFEPLSEEKDKIENKLDDHDNTYLELPDKLKHDIHEWVIEHPLYPSGFNK